MIFAGVGTREGSGGQSTVPHVHHAPHVRAPPHYVISSRPIARGCSPHFLYRYHILPTLLYCTSNSTNFSRHSSHRTHLCNPRITPFLPFRYSNLHHLRPKAQPLCNIDIYPLLRRHSSFRALICPSVHPCRTIRPAPIHLSPLRLSPFP